MRLVAIGEAAEALGVTLRRWEASGKLIPARTAAGHRRYDLAKLNSTEVVNVHLAGLFLQACCTGRSLTDVCHLRKAYEPGRGT